MNAIIDQQIQDEEYRPRFNPLNPKHLGAGILADDINRIPWFRTAWLEMMDARNRYWGSV